MPRVRWASMLVMLVAARGAAAVDDVVPRIAVIAAPTEVHLKADRRDLRDVFLKRTVIDSAGKPLVPLNLPPDSPLRQAFSEALLGQPPRMLEQYWNQRYFHGVSPPYVVRSQEAMLRFVATTPGAVGYVMDCRVDDRVRVLARLPVPRDFAGRLAERCPATSRSSGH